MTRDPLGTNQGSQHGLPASTVGATGTNGESHNPESKIAEAAQWIALASSVSSHAEIETPWIQGEVEGKLSVSIESGLAEAKGKLEVNFKEHKGSIEGNVGHVLHSVVKISADLKDDLLKAVKERSAKGFVKALSPKISAEKELKGLGPLKVISLGFQISTTPIRVTYGFEFHEFPKLPGSVGPDLDTILLGPAAVFLSNQNIHEKISNALKRKLHAQIKYNLEIELGIGPGPEAWEWLIETVGEPAAELLIDVTPVAVIGAALLFPFYALHALFQAEKTGKLQGDCWNYAGSYALTVYGGKLGSIESTWQDEAGKNTTQSFRQRGARDAVYDARHTGRKILSKETVSEKAALQIYATSFKKDRKIATLKDARRAMFDETFAAITKKFGIDEGLLKGIYPDDF